MKIIKLIIATIIIIIIVIGAFSITSKVDNENNPIETTKTDIDISSLYNINKWDKNKYKEARNRIEQHCLLNDITESEEIIYKETLNRIIGENIERTLTAEFNKNNYAYNTIANCYEGIKYISNIDNKVLRVNKNLNNQYRITQLYFDIQELKNKNFDIDVDCDRTTNTWSPNYDNFKNEISNQKDYIVNNSLYDNIAKNEKLNQLELSERLKDAEDNFYDKIASKYIAYHKEGLCTINDLEIIANKIQEQIGKKNNATNKLSYYIWNL